MELNEYRSRFVPLGQSEIEVLARYNGERARGIVHTPEWDERMAQLQARFAAMPPWMTTPRPKPRRRRVMDVLLRVGSPRFW